MSAQNCRLFKIHQCGDGMLRVPERHAADVKRLFPDVPASCLERGTNRVARENFFMRAGHFTRCLFKKLYHGVSATHAPVVFDAVQARTAYSGLVVQYLDSVAAKTLTDAFAVQ